MRTFARLLALAGAAALVAAQLTVTVTMASHVSGPDLVQSVGRCGTVLSGVDGTGYQTTPGTYDYALPATVASPGDAVDHQWVQDFGAGDPIVFDMGEPRVNVLLFPSIDHGPVPDEALESTVYGSNSPAGPWTVSADITAIFDAGFDAAWISDDYVSLWTFGAAYRYVAVGWGGPKALLADGDNEIDAVCAATDIQPRAVEDVIFPGGSIDVEKKITTPALPPVVDVCLLEDETGSFGDDIANLNTAASSLYDAIVAASPGAQFAVAGFRDYPASPHGSTGDWVYRLLSSMDPAKAAWLAGIAALTASGGNDFPEAQYDAIVAATGPGTFTDPTLGDQADCGWRDASSGAQRVLIVATDAPFTLPHADGHHVNTAVTTTAALLAEDIIVIGLKASGAGTELDGLAAATGGSVQALSSNGANIAAAILAGLAAVEVEVSMESTCTAPISTTFSPNPQTVTSGGTATFTETISVASDAPGGTYTCRDVARINGELLTDAEGHVLSEVKTIKVPEGFLTGGGQIVDGGGKNADRVSFGGNVGFLADFSLVGNWNVKLHDVAGIVNDGGHFKGKDPTYLQFAVICGPGPNPPPANANFAHFIFTGEYNGVDGYTLHVWAADYGEPGKDSDAIRIALHDPANVLVYASTGTDFPDNDLKSGCVAGDNVGHQLDGGNLQIHSGTKD